MQGGEYAGRTEAALQPVIFVECLLQRMQLRRRLGAMPSTVRNSWPSACTASIRHERAERPSIGSLQAPHTPCSHPRCVPVRPGWWRMGNPPA